MMSEAPKNVGLLPTPDATSSSDVKKPLLSEPKLSSLPPPENFIKSQQKPGQPPPLSMNPEPPPVNPTKTLLPNPVSGGFPSVNVPPPLLPSPFPAVNMTPFPSMPFQPYFGVGMSAPPPLQPWPMPPFGGYPMSSVVPSPGIPLITASSAVLPLPQSLPGAPDSTNAVIASGPLNPLESAERKLETVLAEVRQFETSCSTWMAQYNDWIKNNKDHPNQQLYEDYQKTWKDYIGKVDETRKQLKEKKEAVEKEVFELKYGKGKSNNTSSESTMVHGTSGVASAATEKKTTTVPSTQDIQERLQRLSKTLAEKGAILPVLKSSLKRARLSSPSAGQGGFRARTSSSSSSSSSSDSSSVDSRHSTSHLRRKTNNGPRTSTSRDTGRRGTERRRDDDRDRQQGGSSTSTAWRSGVEQYSYNRSSAESVCSFGYYTGAPEVIDYGHVRHYGTIVPVVVAQQFRASGRKLGVSEWTPNEATTSMSGATETDTNRTTAENISMEDTSASGGHLFPSAASINAILTGAMNMERNSGPMEQESAGHSQTGKDESEDPYDPHFFFTTGGSQLPLLEEEPHPGMNSFTTAPAGRSVGPALTPLREILEKPGRDKRGSRVLIILRGLPGSGKSRLCQMIKEKECSVSGQPPRILCLDDYFLQGGGKYEYEKDLEPIYRADMFRVFKRSVDQNHFPLILLDGINAKVADFDEFVSYARLKAMKVFVLEVRADIRTCAARNIHGYKEEQLKELQEEWDPTPLHFDLLDSVSLLGEEEIAEVEMEDAMEHKEVDNSNNSGLVKSKWDNENVEDKKLRLDGLRKKPVHHGRAAAPRSIQEFLDSESLSSDVLEDRPLRPGEKRVRWADLEELKKQSRRKQLGFVVGQTDWDKLAASDDVVASEALNRFKYF